MFVCATSGSRGQGAVHPVERSGTWGAICLDFACHTVLESAAEDEQARVLAGVEWIRHARAGPPSEAIWLVVVAGAVAVKRPEMAGQS